MIHMNIDQNWLCLDALCTIHMQIKQSLFSLFGTTPRLILILKDKQRTELNLANDQLNYVDKVQLTIVSDSLTC